MRSLRRFVVFAVWIVLGITPNLARAGDIKGKISTTGLKAPENVVVYIDTIPGKKFDAPAEHAIVDQRNMKFVPHVQVVQRGTTVDFLNSDQVAHNIYWPSIGGNKNLRHSLTILSPNQKKSFQFENLGSAQLLCNLHPEMLGYILVVPTPYFTRAGDDGSFVLKNVPPGTYTLKSWSEEGKTSSQTITVSDGTTTVDVSLKP